MFASRAYRARSRRRVLSGWCGWLACLIGVVTGTGMLAVPGGLASAAVASRPAHGGPGHAVRAAGAGGSDAQTLALEQARRTGKPVTVPSLTDATSITRAMPDGQLALTTSAEPVRAWVGGQWRALDATLRPGPGGAWSPAVSSSPVTISGGGSRPLATMTSASRSMSLYWPGRLPRPAVTGDTALYRSVLPGVDLRVTVDDEGGFSDVLVIHDRAAAGNPALKRLTLTAVTTGGLRLTSGPAGTMQAATEGGAPAFTAPAPLMWDSATTAALPSRARTAAGNAASSAAPAIATPSAPSVSTPAQPGRRAHAAWVRTVLGVPVQRSGVTRQALSLVPDAALLTSPGAVYPAYIDPSWYPSGGSRGWYASDASIYTSNYYDNTADPAPEDYLQVGNNGTFTAHTFVDMQLNSSQLKNAVINSATLQFTEETSWSCTASPIELWWAGWYPVVGGKPFISWDDEPAWQSFSGSGALPDGAITSLTVAHGSSSCPAGTIDFNITGFMQSEGPAGPANIPFGLKAPDSSTSEWKEFSNAPGAITMTTYYDHRPSPQADSQISPATVNACQSASAADAIVGNDDFTLQTTPSDPDGGAVTVRFVLTPYGSTTALLNTVISGSSGEPAEVIISRATVQSWHSNGATAAYTYSWYTVTSDGLLDNSGDTGIGSQANPCLFTYNPAAPQAPGITIPAAANSDGSIGDLGATATFTLGNCTTVLASPPAACTGNAPVTYTYQVDDGAESSVTVSGTSQQLTIPLTRYGANTISVTALSSGGNASAATIASFDVDPPAAPYGDGDYAGTGNPDLITVGDGTGSVSGPGLWLAESDGAGHLGTPIDIGTRGTGLNTNGTPADWAGAQVLHGDFTGDHVQDIVAYFPPGTGASAGTLQMISGPGTDVPLDPESGSVQTVPGAGDPAPSGTQNPLGDLLLDGTGADTPVDLVAASDASLRHTGLPDLIGILGDPVNGYELNIYTATPAAAFGAGYGAASIAASTTATSNGPDGAPWGPDWSLAVAQPSGQAVLFALDRTDGQLWESVNPGQSTSTLIGMPGSTWTQITGGPWAANSGPALAQADVDSAGNIELWLTSGGTATSWTLPPPSATTGDTSIPLTQGPATSLNDPGHAWPLTDVAANAPNGTGTLIDTQSDTGGATASGVDYTPGDPFLGPAGVFSAGSHSSLTLPAGMLQDTSSARNALQSVTLSLRFRASPGSVGILAGTSTGALSALSNDSAPIVYIGTDGHLYAQFPSAHVNTPTDVDVPDITPMESAERVDDGLWHTVTLVADGVNHDQILYLDNDIPTHLLVSGYVDPSMPPVLINPGQTATFQNYGTDQVTIGAGVFSDAGWVNSDAASGANGTPHVSYFTGEISDVTFYPYALTQSALPHNVPTVTNSVINLNLAPTDCVDNNGGTASSPGGTANGNKVQLWACNGNESQVWSFQPNGTITLTDAPGHCLEVTGAGTANNTLVDLYACNGTGAEQWQVESDGAVMNPESGKCLDDPGGNTANGTQLDIYNCSGPANQTWASLVRPAYPPLAGTIVSNQSGLCVDNNGGTSTSPGSLANGNVIQVWSCNGFPSQQWSYQINGEITVAGHCMQESGTAAGDKIELETCNDSAAQQWAHRFTGAFANAASGDCLDAGANAVGTQLQIWGCNQTADQTWSSSDFWAH